MTLPGGDPANDDRWEGMVRSMNPVRRPGVVIVTVAALVFLGVTAVAGGGAMLLGRTPPDAWLDGVPMISSWTVPGLILTAGFGVGALTTAYGVVRRPRWRLLRPVEVAVGEHWSWLATILLGLGLTMWIALEVVYLPQTSLLQVVYAGVGIVLLVLSLHPRLRDGLADRPSPMAGRELSSVPSGPGRRRSPGEDSEHRREHDHGRYAGREGARDGRENGT